MHDTQTIILASANAAACSVPLWYCATIAWVMPSHGMWRERISVILLTIFLGLHAISPWADFLPPPTWLSVGLHVMLAVAIINWRRYVETFIACKFVPPNHLPQRRVSDHLGSPT